MPIVRGTGTVLPGRVGVDPDYDEIVAEMEASDPGVSRRGLWGVHGATLRDCIDAYSRASGEPVTPSNLAPWGLFAYQPFPETPVLVSCSICRNDELLAPDTFDFTMKEGDEVRFNPRLF